MEFVEGNYKPTSFLDAILKSSVPDIEKGKSTYSYLKMGLVYKSLVFISDYDLKKRKSFKYKNESSFKHISEAFKVWYCFDS